MKIPRRLNAVLDWAAGHGRAMLIIVPVVVAAVAALWLPTVAAFAIGVGVGGVAVNVRMGKQVARLRAETDDLLRENGALRHEKIMITKRAVATGSLLTQKMPSVPQKDEE